VSTTKLEARLLRRLREYSAQLETQPPDPRRNVTLVTNTALIAAMECFGIRGDEVPSDAAARYLRERPYLGRNTLLWNEESDVRVVAYRLYIAALEFVAAGEDAGHPLVRVAIMRAYGAIKSADEITLARARELGKTPEGKPCG
jgi:hypothetical protein